MALRWAQAVGALRVHPHKHWSNRFVKSDRRRSEVSAFFWRIGGGHALSATHHRLPTFLTGSGCRWTSHRVSTTVGAAVHGTKAPTVSGEVAIRLWGPRSSTDSVSTRLAESVNADGAMLGAVRSPHVRAQLSALSPRHRRRPVAVIASWRDVSLLAHVISNESFGGALADHGGERQQVRSRW
jgi:hypothetical protein